MYKQFKISNGGTLYAKDYPSECPCCHETITPNWLFQKADLNNTDKFHAFLHCPSPKCNKCFTAVYVKDSDNKHKFDKIEIGELKSSSFSDIINETSPSFIKIYNEAFYAEQNQLLEITGVGYRKALEYLIKDYLIESHPDKEAKIKELFLGKAINNFIENEQIKVVASRAAWLGNDETHYVRKWEGKNLSDLKTLIELTVRWIEMEKLTNKFQNEMTNKKETISNNVHDDHDS